MAEIGEQYQALIKQFERREPRLASLADARANAPRLEPAIVKPALLGTRSSKATPLSN
jgi:hypothetical protein